MLQEKKLLDIIEHAGKLLNNGILSKDEFGSFKRYLFEKLDIVNITEELCKILKSNDEELRIFLVKKYIKLGADVNKVIDGKPIIHIVCGEKNNNLNILREIIKAGADVKATDKDGNTALHIMADKKEKKIPEFLPCLLEAGIDINAQNKHGETALMLAKIYSYYIEDVETLLDAGADLTIKDNSGDTAMEYGDFPDGADTRVIEYICDAWQKSCSVNIDENKIQNLIPSNINRETDDNEMSQQVIMRHSVENFPSQRNLNL